MDPLTHTLSGIVAGKLISKNKSLIWFVLVFSLLPDVDMFLLFHSKELFLTYHRGITHGILFLFLLPLIPAIIFRKKFSFFPVYASSFLGYGLHILLDLTNQYGTRVLYPLDETAYNLSLTFIVDPYVILPLILALLISLKIKRGQRFLLIFSLILIAFYIGIKAYLKGEAKEFLKQRIEAHQYRVYPLPNDFARWWFVVRHSNEYITGVVDLFTKRVYIDNKYTIKDNDLVLKSKESKSVKALLHFSKHPAFEIRKEGDVNVVIWRELSYAFLPEDRFTAKVWLKENPEGYKILNEKLKI